MSRYVPGASPEGFRSALREVWLAPGRFFARLDPDGGPIRPTIFAVLVLFLNLLLDTALAAAWNREFNLGLINAPLLGLVAAVILTPLLISGFAALVLVVLDGAPSRRGFGPVYRALGYASGIGIIAWIPYGPFLAVPYGAYVATVAVKNALGLTWRHAAIATLVPLAALLLILLLLTGAGEAYSFLLSPPDA